jgi:hypothetical protein
MAGIYCQNRQSPPDGADDDADTSTPADRTLDVVNTTTHDETIDRSTTLVGAVLIGDRRFLSIGAGHELSESSACSKRTSFAAEMKYERLPLRTADDIGYNASFISQA